MAKNCIQSPTRVVELVAPYDLASGAVAKVGDFIGVALVALSSGQTGNFALDGIWVVPKVNTVPAAQGGRLLWSDSSKAITTLVTTTNTHAGAALNAAATTDTEVAIVLGYPPKAGFTA